VQAGVGVGVGVKQKCMMGHQTNAEHRAYCMHGTQGGKERDLPASEARTNQNQHRPQHSQQDR
jgi:hypothetical protein